jgi:hypothetical protein
MTKRFAILFVAAAALFATVSLRAEQLQPVQARSIGLGAVSGVAYFTANPDGDRLVATLVGSATAAPIRVVATLAAGQSVTLSVPRGVGEPAIEVTFVRRGDSVFVIDGVPPVGGSAAIPHQVAERE